MKPQFRALFLAFAAAVGMWAADQYSVTSFAGGFLCFPTAMNNNGQAVGWCYDGYHYCNSMFTYGFLFSGGNWSRISVPAAAINNQGEIVGCSANPDCCEQGYPYAAGVASPLGFDPTAGWHASGDALESSIVPRLYTAIRQARLPSREPAR